MPVYRAQAFRLDPATLQPIETLRPLGGEVRVEYGSPIRRTLSGFTIPGRARFADPIRVEVDAGNGWTPVITAYPDDPHQSLVPGGSTLAMDGRDGMRLLAESYFAQTRTYAATMGVSAFLRQLLTDAGWGTDDTRYDFDDGDQTLGIPHTYEIQRNRLEVAFAVAADFDLELVATPERIARLRPNADPTTAPIVATYRRGADVRMTSFDKTWRTGTQNIAIVIGNVVDRLQIRAERRITNVAAPGYNPPEGETGHDPSAERADIYRSDSIVSERQAAAVCLSRLYANASPAEQVDLSAPPDPTLDAGQIIEVEESITGSSGRHKLFSFTVPLSPAAQPLRTQRVSALI